MAGANIGATHELSDVVVLGIYTRVCREFREVSIERGERATVTANHLAMIALYFMAAYGRTGPEFFEEHFIYELENYSSRAWACVPSLPKAASPFPGRRRPGRRECNFGIWD